MDHNDYFIQNYQRNYQTQKKEGGQRVNIFIKLANKGLIRKLKSRLTCFAGIEKKRYKNIIKIQSAGQRIIFQSIN